jgi:hypothetical protein
MIDRERLEEMRVFAREVREDLERREAEDPLGAFELAHPRAAPPALVFKVTDNAAVKRELEDGGQFAHRSKIVTSDGQVPPFSDEQIDIIAKVIAELRAEFQDVVRERVAVLEGKLELLTTLLQSKAVLDLPALPELKNGHRHDAGQPGR